MASFSASRPGAGHSASQVAGARFHNFHAALPQDLQVRLRGRMIPHVDVHGGRDDDRRGGREIKSGQKIAGDSLREVSQNVRRRRRDHERINGLRNRNVLDGRVDVGFMLFAAWQRTCR